MCCSGEYRLTLELFRHLSTDSVEVDVQPTYVRAYINNKIFQLRYTSHSTDYIRLGLYVCIRLIILHRRNIGIELKGPKHEIFESGFFTQIRRLWLGDLETG